MGTRLWVANHYGNDVIEVNTVNGDLVRVLDEPPYDFEAPSDIAYSSGQMWVTNNYGNTVTEFPAS